MSHNASFSHLFKSLMILSYIVWFLILFLQIFSVCRYVYISICIFFLCFFFESFSSACLALFLFVFILFYYYFCHFSNGTEEKWFRFGYMGRLWGKLRKGSHNQNIICEKNMFSIKTLPPTQKQKSKPFFINLACLKCFHCSSQRGLITR